jgi:hypothetical protein
MERLAAARRQRFVGREAERNLFCAALEASEFPFGLIYLYGAGGVGKTTLLRQFAYWAEQQQVRAIYLDSRNIEPAPNGFLGALQANLSCTTIDEIVPTLANYPERTVLLVDTVELLTPIDGWLRESFLPQLPANLLCVIAGRNPPDLAWRTDPGWSAMMRVLPLQNLSSAESREYLRRCQIPTPEHEAVCQFTHGHPLALSLVVDAFAQRVGSHFQPEAAPDIIKTLLDQFAQKAPSPAHRAALEACALVRLLTEPLLAALLETPNAHELFEWLRSLSFIDSERYGLFPHDLAREALTADTRWRNPDWYGELHQRARSYYIARIQLGDREEQGRVLAHYVYLHRDNPVVRPYFEWQTSSSVFSDAMRPTDPPELLAMVEQHEGPQAARLAAHWLDRQPEGVSVVRSASGEPQGFVQFVALDKVEPSDLVLDTAVQSVWSYLQRYSPLRSGEAATLFRFWMASEGYQVVSSVQSRIFFTMVQHYLVTPRLAYTFLPCANPAFWEGVFAYADLTRLEAADFTVDGRRYGVYGHDWRTVPPLEWLALLAEREVNAEAKSPQMVVAEKYANLSQGEFIEAVHDALRNFTNQNVLRNSPLLQSRVVLRRCQHDKTTNGRISVLQLLLHETAVFLKKSPKQVKAYRALHHTYFEPAQTQEQAAELLDLPFSTYRRHLRTGLAEVATQLWQQEVE